MYLQSYSANVEYKVVDRSTLQVLEVNSKGIANGVHTIPITKSTTVGEICDGYQSNHALMVQMKNGLIHAVVARDTKAAKLIDDGHSYRIDLYQISPYISGNDTFYVCVKFVGNSPEERKQTPLLMKIKNAQSFNCIGMQIFSLLGMSNMQAIKGFQYSFADKFVQKEQVLQKPDDPESIPVVLVNTNQVKPNNSYRAWSSFYSK